jgi:hypothetical protein
MSENVLKKPEQGTKSDKPKSPGILQSVLDGSILQGNKMVSLLPFLFFITFLAIVLIFNTYYAEKQAREIEILRKEVVDYHLKHISVKSELMYLSNQSEIARKLREKGFEESVVPPKIVREQKRRKNIFIKMFSNN